MLKDFLRVKTTDNNVNNGILIFRIIVGTLLMYHGYTKLSHFSEMQNKFMSVMGMSVSLSLSLTIFAEFFCSLLVVFGALTRLACIPILINMIIALAKAHNWNIFAAGEMATLFIASFLLILITGPGKYSVDKALFK